MRPDLVSYLRSLLFLFVFSACSTERIYISVLQPAEVSVPSTIQKVSLFPGGGFPSPVGKYDSIQHVKLIGDCNYNKVKRGYMEGVYEIISQSPRFKKVVLSDTVYEKFLTEGTISLKQLQEICDHDSTDTILLLKKAITQDVLSYFTEDDYCSLHYQLITSTKWCFYQPSSKLSSEDLLFTDVNDYEQEITCEHLSPLRNVEGMLYDACTQTGKRFGEKICPSWSDGIQRIIFSGPGKSLKKACFLATHNQWNQAAAIWNDLSDSPNRNRSAHASYNMALAWERDDDLNQALEWAGYADSLKSTKSTKAYIIILDQRIRLKAELDNQMAGN